MKRIVLIALAALSSAHAQTTWNLATGYSANSFHTENILQMAQDVEKATSGALRIAVHPAGTLHKLADIRPAVEAGRLDAGETIMTSMVQDIPIAGADSIPFVVKNYTDARRLWDLQRPLIEKHFARRGLVPLYAVPWPPQGLFTRSPVQAAADFKGKRMRTYNLSTRRIAEILGAAPVDVSMLDVNKALASGQIDSMITSAITGVENQVWGQVGHYYTINAWIPKNIVFVNAKAFQSLSPEVRQSVMSAAAQAEQRGWAASEAVAVASTQTLADKGIQVASTSANFDAELKRLGERFSREWVHAVGHEANQIFVPYYFQR